MRDLCTGDLLNDKFLIEGVLGSGGMGIVYKAMHTRMRKRVAIKVLDAQHASDPVSVTRFEREGLAAGRLQGRHTVRVFDVDRTKEGQSLLVMELLRGQDLSTIASEGQQPVEKVVDWVIQVCSAIHEAHQRGIIHRDLKPSNIFILQHDGSVKVCDFGISKVADGTDLTSDSQVLGTPKYMSPEQLMGEAPSPTFDIWSTGIVLYQLLTGAHPYPTTIGEPVFVTAAAILTQPPVPIDDHRPDLPDGLSSVVMRCIEQEPRNRWQTAKELALALEEFGSGHVQFEEVPIDENSEPPAYLASVEHHIAPNSTATGSHDGDMTASARMQSLPPTIDELSNLPSTPAPTIATGLVVQREQSARRSGVVAAVLVGVLGLLGVVAAVALRHDDVTEPADSASSFYAHTSASVQPSAPAVAASSSGSHVGEAPPGTPDANREPLDGGLPRAETPQPNRRHPGSPSTATRPPRADPSAHTKPPAPSGSIDPLFL